MARRRWQIDFKNILTGERETPGIKCYKSYKSYKVYKFYNALFKWRGKEQLSNLHRWNAVFALNLNLGSRKSKWCFTPTPMESPQWYLVEALSAVSL